MRQEANLANRPMVIFDAPPSPPEDPSSEKRSSGTSWWKTLGKGAALLAAIGLLIVNIVETRATRTVAEAAKASSDRAQDMVMKSHRPWMGTDGPLVLRNQVEISHPKLTEAEPSQTQIQIPADFVVKNFGADPAFYVGVNADILASQNATNVYQYSRDFKEAARATCVAADIEGTSVLAGEAGSGPTVLPGNQRTISNYQFNRISPGQRTDVPLTIVGCISYRDEFKKNLHHTGFCFKSDAPITAIVKGQQLQACPMNTEAD